LDAVVRDAKSPPKWEYKVVEGVLGPEKLAQLGDEGWELIPVPQFPLVIYPTKVDLKTGQVSNVRIDVQTGRQIDLGKTLQSITVWKRRKG
jgi:hypothetical protein